MLRQRGGLAGDLHCGDVFTVSVFIGTHKQLADPVKGKVMFPFKM